MYTQKRKSYRITMLVIITALVLLTTVYSVSMTSASLYGIEQEEVEMIMNQNRALVDQEILPQYALELYYQIKSEQILSKKWGLEEDISYSAFLKEFEKENKRREQMLQEGKVIYGPKKYTLEQYYAYRNSNRRMALQEYVIKSGQITSEDISNYYEQYKDDLYIKPSTYELVVTKQENSTSEIESHTLVIDENNIREYSKTNWEFIQQIVVLQQGEKLSLVSNQGEVYQVTCQNILSNGYMAREEVEDHIKTLLAKQEVERLIEPILEEFK